MHPSAQILDHRRDGAAASRGDAPAVIWHELECGSYRADLPLWRELARSHSDGPILEIGAGGGRVALDLARAGHTVIALDHDQQLLAALEQRAQVDSLGVRCVRADACAFDLEECDLAMCLVPMQTIQMFGGAAQRIAFLRRARAHLRPGGLVACAITADPDLFDVTAGGTGPAPETVRVGEAIYVSRATRVALHGQRLVIERERRIAVAGRKPIIERSMIELDRVSPHELEREGALAGLHPERQRQVAPTDEHTGSTVVMLRA